jgi:hypothetical protein
MPYKFAENGCESFSKLRSSNEHLKSGLPQTARQSRKSSTSRQR